MNAESSARHPAESGVDVRFNFSVASANANKRAAERKRGKKKRDIFGNTEKKRASCGSVDSLIRQSP